MLINYSHVKRIFIVCGKTDMRQGIDGLARIVSDTYHLDRKGLTRKPLTETYYMIILIFLILLYPYRLNYFKLCNSI